MVYMEPEQLGLRSRVLSRGHDGLDRGGLLPVWRSTSGRAPDDSSLSHFSVMTRPCWLRREVRIATSPRHRAGGACLRSRRDDSARKAP